MEQRKTKFTFIMSVLFIVSCIVSCASTKTVKTTSSKTSSFSLDTKDGWENCTHFYAGARTEGLSNDTYMAAFISKLALADRTDLKERLDVLGFQKDDQYSTDTSMMSVELFPNLGKRIYIVFKTIDNTPISDSTWGLLETEFPNWFGPTLFDVNGNLFGRLEHSLEVRFDDQLSELDRKALIEKHGGVETYFKRGNSIIVFKNIFGYEILEIAENMNAEESVIHASNTHVNQIIML